MAESDTDDLNHAMTVLLGLAEVMLQERLNALEDPHNVSVLNDSRTLTTPATRCD
jgi:hypothetical protein